MRETANDIAAFVHGHLGLRHLIVRPPAEDVTAAAGVTLVEPTPVRNLDPRTDYGRFIYRTPACVVEPRTRDELAHCVQLLAAAGVPFTLRGCAHSSGGQVLTNDVVISTRRLRRIVADDPGTGRIRVEGGALWVDVVMYLRRRGRRVPVLTGNLLTTVAGTLAAGGVGVTSHAFGLQITTVTRLVLVLPNGETVSVGPEDALFRFTLAGAGQVAIIAEAELTTIRRPPYLLIQQVRWNSVAAFHESAGRIRETARYEVLAARFCYASRPTLPFVAGHVGIFSNLGADRNAAFGDDVRRFASGPPEMWRDGPIPEERRAPQASQEYASPGLVAFLPLPQGIDVWPAILRDLEEASLTHYMAGGSGLGILPVDRRYPLAPYPDSDECLFVALRPELPQRDVPRALATLRRIAHRVLDAGGKVDFTSLTPTRELVRRQLGARLDDLLALKAQVDPQNLLNAGFLALESDGDDPGTRMRSSTSPGPSARQRISHVHEGTRQ